ncbi:transposase [Rhodobacter capsulatus]|uniref:transposase n=1 Tax=Rhodobacter capsulatus TaxID=1061 RepID=UPI00402A1C47
MLEILDVTNTGRRRRFSLAEKIRIVEESLSGPKLARATARRYGIALSGLYQWRRQYQRGELGGDLRESRRAQARLRPEVDTADLDAHRKRRYIRT